MSKLVELFNEFPVLDMGDFLLRRVELADCEDLFEIYHDEEVMKYQGEPIKSNIEQIKEYIEFIENGFNRRYFIRWIIEDKSLNRVVGLVSFHHIDFKNNNGQIGYILNRAFWGKGIMSFILNGFIKYLIDDISIHKLEASIHPENLASIRIAEKLGFEIEGCRKDCVYNSTNKAYESRIIMGLVNNKI